jgi:uncharacterized protein (DUF302 family)
MNAQPELPDGVIQRPSPFPVDETVERLTLAIDAAGAKLFTVIDHSGEAEAAGMSLRDTKLLIFGSPVGGTPIMDASPLAALDLPLKILVWDDAGQTWMTFLSPDWLAARHGIAAWLSQPLHAVDALTAKVADAAAG